MSLPQPAAGAAYAVASLYVGDLSQDVTEAMLFEKFSTVGPVLSIRVCRDVASRRSLGYAYVNFQNAGDAQHALAGMNFDEMKGRPMRIMWSQRDPSLRRSGKNNIFIKNLDKSIDNRGLHEIFHSFGPILSCKVAQDDSGSSRGYGFVHFQEDTAAKTAIERVDGMLLNDRKVFVGPFVPRKERMKNRDTTTFTNVYVKNFDDSLTDEGLGELFNEFGEITSCKVMRKEDGSSKGFGFCAFQDPAAAEAAVKALYEKDIGGKVLYVARAQKRSERDHELQKLFHQKKAERQKNYQGVNLYIKNLHDDVTDERLRQEFSVYGDISSAKVMVDDKGRSKGFGFVCFSSPEQATKAVTEMNNKPIGGKPLYVALAQRKEERKAQLAAQMLNRTNPPQLRMAAGQPMAPMFPHHMYLPMGNRLMPGPIRPQRNQWPTARAPAQHFMMGATPSQAQFLSTVPTAVPQRIRPARTNSRTSGPPQARASQGKSRGNTSSYPRYTHQPIPGVTDVAVANHDIDTEKLARATPQEQKQMLGERLFPKVREIEATHSGKITGMLLEIDNSEILHMLESDESLRAKVEEARDVLRAHQANGCGDQAKSVK